VLLKIKPFLGTIATAESSEVPIISINDLISN
jgi:hypothetical protein